MSPGASPPRSTRPPPRPDHHDHRPPRRRRVAADVVGPLAHQGARRRARPERGGWRVGRGGPRCGWRPRSRRSSCLVRVHRRGPEPGPPQPGPRRRHHLVGRGRRRSTAWPGSWCRRRCPVGRPTRARSSPVPSSWARRSPVSSGSCSSTCRPSSTASPRSPAAIGAAVVTLGYMFLIGRVMASSFILDAVVYERIGSVSELVFGVTGAAPPAPTGSRGLPDSSTSTAPRTRPPTPHRRPTAADPEPSPSWAQRRSGNRYAVSQQGSGGPAGVRARLGQAGWVRS